MSPVSFQVPYHFGVMTAQIPLPLQDLTVYRINTDMASITVEQTSWSQDTPSLADDITRRLTDMYGEAATINTSTTSLLGQDLALVTGTVPALLDGSASVSAVSPSPVQLSVALIPKGFASIPRTIRLTHATSAPAAAQLAPLLANIANANIGGPVPDGLTRHSLAGLVYDVPSAYSPPSVYRFGASQSLMLKLEFGTTADLPTAPEDDIWFDPSYEQLVSELAEAETRVTAGAIAATSGRWSIHRESSVDGSTIEDWLVWRLYADVTTAVRVQILGKALGADIATLDGLWPGLLASIGINR
jgi:hypothetical protein